MSDEYESANRTPANGFYECFGPSTKQTKKDAEDWTGIEVVQVKAKDLAKLHHELSGLRAALKEARKQLAEFCGMSVTEVKSTKGIIAKYMKDLDSFRSRESSFHSQIYNFKKDLKTADETILKLKAALFDKSNH